MIQIERNLYINSPKTVDTLKTIWYNHSKRVKNGRKPVKRKRKVDGEVNLCKNIIKT